MQLANVRYAPLVTQVEAVLHAKPALLNQEQVQLHAIVAPLDHIHQLVQHLAQLVPQATQPQQQARPLSVNAPFAHLAMGELLSPILDLLQVDVLFVQLAPTKLQA